MPAIDLGAVATIALALLAAMLFAVSAALQQGAARRAAGAAGQGRWLTIIGILRTLLTDRRWLAGQGANVAGFVVHAVALRIGAIAVVQALLVVQLLFALPLAAARRGRATEVVAQRDRGGPHRAAMNTARRRRGLLVRDWVGTALVCGGLILLVGQGVPPHSGVRLTLLPGAAVGVVVVIAVLIGLARLVRSTQLRSALAAIAAGCCFASTAVLVVAATAALPQPSWALLGIPVTTVAGGLLAQEAYARGSLPTALTAMTITDPVLSYAAGMTLFAVAAQPHPVLLAGAAALVIWGVVLLAHSPTLHDERANGAPANPAATVGV